MSQVYQGLMGPWVDKRKMMTAGVVSLGLHLAVLVLLVWLPEIGSQHEFLGPVYTVDLVGMPGPPPPPPAPGDPETGPTELAPKDAVLPEPARVVPPQPAELIPIGKEPAKEEAKKKEPEKVEPLAKLGTPKESSKSAQIRPEEEIDKALDKIEKKVTKDKAEQRKKPGPGGEKSDQQHLEKALARAQQRAEAGAYGTGGGGGGGSSRFAPYYDQIRKRVWSNWTLPQEWTTSSLEAIIIIEVLPNGAIAGMKFEKRSGNQSFDQSVQWAVERSNPLPPFPSGMAAARQEIGIRFKPEG